MDKQFHVFIRKQENGAASVGVLTHPEYTAFAPSVDDARADLVTALMSVLSEGKSSVTRTTTHWPGLKLRRVDLAIRAVQQRRMLDVPMRFTVLTHPDVDENDEIDVTEGLVVRVPRLGIVDHLHDAADLMPFAEELIRHRLHMVALHRLLDVTYAAEETVDVISVPWSMRPEREEKKKEQRKKPRRTPVLGALAEATHRLNDDVEHDRLGHAFEMDAVLAQLAQAITGRHGSVMLVGPSGSGKTALVHELVRRAEGAAEGDALRGLEVYSTSANRIIAGMRYLGQWQQRVAEMIDALRGKHAVLHIESLAELLTMRSGESGMDLAQFLQQPVETGEIAVICEATPEDIARAERTHPSLIHAFRRLTIPPMDALHASLALGHAAQRIAKRRKVSFSTDALHRASELNDRFGTGAAVLGGAIQLLQAAAGRERTTGEVTGSDVIKAFSTRTGYPVELIDPQVPLDPDAVLKRLRTRVVGQDAAMLLLRDLVVTLKTGLSDPARPLGSFLLLGPTGVGKTESALALAEYLFGDEKRVARFDMAEYAAPGSASRLVSTYGGTEGVLAKRVREQPFGIVLLDEIEKADLGVHDLLLQILGEGRLTDGTGQTVNFRHTVVMLTSNLGADTVSRRLGFSGGDGRDVAQHYLAAASQFFRPELLNRIDHVVPYHALGAEVVQAIARKLVAAALEREGLSRRGVKVVCGDDVIQRVAELGFDARYGARPLKRAVETWIVGPVARLLAAAGAHAPSSVEVALRHGTIGIAPTSAQAVLSLEGDALARELGALPSTESAEIVVQPESARAVAEARWLASLYARFCVAHGGTCEERSTEPDGIVLRLVGRVAALLVHECGEHVFTDEGGRHRVRVSSTGHEVPLRTRAYESVPAELVSDGATGLQRVGPWREGFDVAWLGRFVLARAQR